LGLVYGVFFYEVIQLTHVNQEVRMLSIILQLLAVALLVGFLFFLARDDMRNHKIREAEKKEEALALERKQQKRDVETTEND